MGGLGQGGSACWSLTVGSVVARGGVYVFGDQSGAGDVEVEQLKV